MIEYVLIGLVIAMLVATMPVFNYNRRWGFGPAGAVSIVLVLLVALLLLGRL